jgi:single-stranded-DNA-specific exonuclease
MKTAIPTDNRTDITCGGATCLYELRAHDMPHISIGDSEDNVAVSRRTGITKEWKFPEQSQVEESIIQACGSNTLAELLSKRGLHKTEDVIAYLDPSQYIPCGPMELPDMPRAVARVNQAIASGEKITIYGDYDVDGVTATAVMVSTLRSLGAAVDYYIPTRSEGYGLNLKSVSVLASKHRTKLIISCDCGISNFSEINFARSLGVDTIVVDHHSMPELLPPASAILHPKVLDEEHKLYHLPGVGVAFKLAQALLEEHGQAQRVPELLDFVTLGMIADMVPLVKECRYLVQIGMPQLVNSERAGLKALLAQVSGRDGGTDLVGFGLAPRINAVGRLSDANAAVRLMITEDATEAAELAKQLEYDNLRRQELCEQIFTKADQAAQANIQAGDKAIAVYGEGWHHGVVGIVASRLVEKYHCPVFIGELDTAEGIVKGSARGVESIDLYQVLKTNEHLALKWGGHKMAAGFSVEAGKAGLFCKGIVETCNRALAEKPCVPILNIDLVADAADVTQEMANVITRMAPFGIANKKPVIVVRGLQCASSRPLGKEGKHSRIVLKATSGEQFECVFWSSQGRVPDDGQIVDAAFFPDINTYNGNSRLQLVLSDWRDPNKPMVSDVVPKPTELGSSRAVVPAVAAMSVDAATTAPVVDVTPPNAAVNAPPPGEIINVMPPGAVVDVTPPPQSNAAPAQLNPGFAQERSISLKDLRNHNAPDSVVQAAVRKLGATVNVFAEGGVQVAGATVGDRTALNPSGHLLLWQFPPSLPVLKGLIEKSAATTIYLVGGSQPSAEDANTFLKRLLGLVRFAVNKREGQADPDRLASALSTTKMAIALGLTILKKINVVEWFAEEGCLYLDILGQPTGKPEGLPEFRQLSNCLKEISEFRNWCLTATISEIQLSIVQAPSTQSPLVSHSQSVGGAGSPENENGGINPHGTASELSSNFS